MSANRPPPSSPLGDPLCLGDLQHDSQKVVTDSPNRLYEARAALSYTVPSQRHRPVNSVEGFPFRSRLGGRLQCRGPVLRLTYSDQLVKRSYEYKDCLLYKINQVITIMTI